MTSVTLNQAVLHIVPSIVTQFSVFRTPYGYTFHTLPCHMSNHATSITLNIKNCKSVTCRYFFNFLHHPVVRCFVTICITLQTVTIEFFRRILLLFSYIYLFYNNLPFSFFITRRISNTSFSFTSFL